MSAYAQSRGQEAADQGIAHLRDSKFEPAIDALKKAVDLDPALLGAWEALGFGYKGAGKFEQAIKCWQLVLKLEPKKISLINEIARTSVLNGALEKSIVFYKKSLEANSEQNAVRMELADIYARLGKNAEAIRLYVALYSQVDFMFKALANCVDLLEKDDKIDKAIHEIEYVGKKTGLPLEIKSRLATLYTRQGDRRYEKVDFSGAIMEYNKALKAQPDNVQTLVNLGWAYRRLDQIKPAIDAWDRLLKINQDAVNVQIYVADAHHDLGDRARSISGYTRAWDKGDRMQRRNIAYKLAQEYTLAGKPEQVKDWLLRAIELCDQDSSWHRRVAATYVSAGLIIEGLLQYEEILSSPVGNNVKDSLAYLYAELAAQQYKAQDYANSVISFHKALRLDNKNNQYLRDLGWAYWQLQDWNKCEKTWRELADNNPQKADAQSLLTQLYLYIERYSDAIGSAKRSLALNDSQPDEYLRLAKAMLLSNQFKPVKALALQIANRYPDNQAIQIFYAETLTRMREFSDAAQQWSKLIKTCSDQEQIAGYQKRWMLAAYETGAYDEAIAVAKHLANTPHPSKQVFKFIIDDAMALENYAEARRWQERLVYRYPSDSNAWRNLSNILTKTGAWRQAIDILLDALERFPDNLRLSLDLGDLYLANQEPDRAYKVFEALSINKNNLVAHNGKIRALLAMGRYEEAEKALNETDFSHANSIDMVFSRAELKVASNDLAAAEGYLETLTNVPKGAVYVPVLLYHGISNGRRSRNILLETFSDQMRALAAEGYEPITMLQLSDYVDGKANLPNKPIIITFDDARLDSFRFADPVLKKYNLKATMFVPTEYPIDDHPFFADWNILRQYSNSGRWDIQSHGHFGHRMVRVNREGDRGGFLVNKEWLEDSKRYETLEEYEKRIKDEYDISVRQIKSHLGYEPVAFAFPFSLNGDDGVSNVEDASTINERYLFKHFRFGFIQEGSGYNLVTSGDATPRIFRRTEVQKQWSGDELIRHLTLKHPVVQGRLSLAKAYMWSGRISKARRLFEDLSGEGSWKKQESSYYLASLEYDLQRYRSAQQALESSNEDRRIVPSGGADRSDLQNKIYWRINPRFQMNSLITQDSNARKTRLYDITYRHPLTLPVDYWVNIGNMVLQENSGAELRTQQAALGLGTDVLSNMYVSWWARARRSLNLPDTTNAWANIIFRHDGALVRGYTMLEDIDTYAARLQRVQSRGVGMTYRQVYNTAWSTEINGEVASLSDGNQRYNAKGTILYRLPSARLWRIGSEANFADAKYDMIDNQNAPYYAQKNIRSIQGVLMYENRSGRYLHMGFEMSAGLAQGAHFQNGIIGRGIFDVTIEWFRRVRTGANAEYYHGTDYRSVRAGVVVEARF